MILRDEDSVEWECSELREEARAKLAADNNAAYMAYRVLQCRPAHHPEAAPRHISFPADVDLEDATAQHWVLGRPLETRAIDPVPFQPLVNELRQRALKEAELSGSLVRQ